MELHGHGWEELELDQRILITPCGPGLMVVHLTTPVGNQGNQTATIVKNIVFIPTSKLQESGMMLNATTISTKHLATYVKLIQMKIQVPKK